MMLIPDSAITVESSEEISVQKASELLSAYVERHTRATAAAQATSGAAKPASAGLHITFDDDTTTVADAAPAAAASSSPAAATSVAFTPLSTDALFKVTSMAEELREAARLTS